ncbi:transposase [Alkalibacterium indicireducens]|uniref:Transposase InsH N-terminal domain-containing protein n=1 Tax=Alkalibacterium indicireducens TaxID=398758 RepID=A0ABP3KH90_9LACT
MSFKPNNKNEMDLFNDSYIQTSERTKKWIKNSWAEPFAQLIFPAINEKRFEILYHEENGRPNTPINYILGALILKEILSLTDEDLKLRCHTDIAIHHALHSTSWDDQPVSDRTFSRFRERCYLYELETGIDLIQAEMEALSDKLMEYFEINPTKKRMDSLMIASNTRNLSRLELLYTCIERVVRKRETLYPSFELSAYQQYLDSYHENEFIYHSDQPYDEKLQVILLDAFGLKETFESTLKEDTDFHLLCRVINDQTTTDEDGTISLKKGKEISPTSLQTPIEPEATYRYKSGKHHKGYVANIVETVDENLSFITHYSFDANIQSDVHFAYEAIEKLGKQEEPTVLVSDGAYDSEDARILGKTNGIDLVTTELKGRSPNPAYAGIIIDEEKNMVELPDGLKAQSVSYYEKTDMYRAVFDKADCSSASDNQEAYGMMKEQKKTNVLMISPRMIQRANQAKQMKTKEFLKYTYFRNGVEGIPSVLRRAYDIDRIPFRGRVRKKHSLGIKIMAINAKRAIKHQHNQEKVMA